MKLKYIKERWGELQKLKHAVILIATTDHCGRDARAKKAHPLYIHILIVVNFN
jgi:hypothetical protein